MIPIRGGALSQDRARRKPVLQSPASTPGKHWRLSGRLGVRPPAGGSP
ncbi:hypothetical protein RR42_m2248 [Cupriavidus basilensis]|uniref:Uncharacterized protein n=1 Tax=Cupriavidus basilensis TaxID=68895 RepID=A0A0C4Y9N8_9BURK|nr:hypothetical protein RR42_m2248 [Cupriavidus basilensis]